MTGLRCPTLLTSAVPRAFIRPIPRSPSLRSTAHACHTRAFVHAGSSVTPALRTQHSTSLRFCQCASRPVAPRIAPAARTTASAYPESGVCIYGGIDSPLGSPDSECTSRLSSLAVRGRSTPTRFFPALHADSLTLQSAIRRSLGRAPVHLTPAAPSILF